MHKLKNLKGVIKRYKLLSVIVLIFIAAIPLFVLATNDPKTGYRALKNTVSQPMFSVAQDNVTVESVGFCVGNGSSNDYFIPTARFADIYSFVNHKPVGVSLLTCVGDGQCTGSETCSNDPGDCGLCTNIVPVNPCSVSCTSSCPCSSYCTLNCKYSGGGGGGGGSSGSCFSYPLFLASCG